jgi:hypothetical protein
LQLLISSLVSVGLRESVRRGGVSGGQHDEAAMRRVRGRGCHRLLLRRRGHAVRRVRPPRALRQQACRKAPAVLPPPRRAIDVAFRAEASALRDVPGQ